MISWEPWQGLAPIVAGELDGYVRTYAAAVAAHHRPLLLRFAHEMNAAGIPWYGPPSLYRQAWTRVHRIFEESGATNTNWVWSPYVRSRSIGPFESFYPGDDLVDWVALDGYNWGRRRWWDRWPGFDAIFAASYASLRALAPDKPMMLAEIGASERGGDKAAWMRDALLRAVPEQYPDISAVVWFNENRPDHADWRVDSSAAALDAWLEVVADPRYALSASELVRR